MKFLYDWVTASRARAMLVSFCVVALFLLLPAAAAISRLTGETGPQPTPTLLPFDVTTVQDVSTPQAVRLQISVSTGFPVSKTQIKEICRQVVDDFTTQRFFYFQRFLHRKFVIGVYDERHVRKI